LLLICHAGDVLSGKIIVGFWKNHRRCIMRKALIIMAVCLVFSGPVWAQEPEAGTEAVGTSPMDWGLEFQRGAIKVGVWSASFHGDIKFVEEEHGVRIGETLDLVDDLELENPLSLLEAEIEVKATRRNRFHASYFQGEYKGDVNEVSGTDFYEFAGEEFKVDVNTAVYMSRIHFGYEFLPVVTPRGDLGLMLGVDYYNLGFRLESEEPEAKEEAFQVLPIPVVGVQGRYTLGYGLGVYGGVNGIGFSAGDTNASYTDIEAGLSFKYKRVYASAGYRSINWHVATGKDEDDEDYGRLNLGHDGILINAGLNF
jgi:hypothetical protein